MEHINRSLDMMITTLPEKRYENAKDVLADVRTLRRVIYEGYNAVSSKLSQICTYCGMGHYRRHEASDSAGLLLVCLQCGHNQRFTINNAVRKDWWDKE